jgi:putative transposase
MGYYGAEVYPQQLLDREFVLDLLSEDRKKAMKMFKDFNEEGNDDSCLEDDERKRLSDVGAREEIKKLLDKVEIEQIKSLPKAQRDKIIKCIKGIEGLTQRQTARVLGVSQKLVSMA